MLEIRHLKTLHALREADSLVEAAERLHLTQSALSHQFKELEERLGMQRRYQCTCQTAGYRRA